MVAHTAEKKPNTCVLPHELFHYLIAHQVLICKSCHYAVQPTAVSRHLKDIHHLSRHERRPFDDYRNTLKLRDPEHVEPPPPEEFPVPHLPVEKGWQCTYPDCHYLCVSTKRMQSHWSTQHGCKGDPSRDWSPVHLQTFFRGNMTKYFTKQSRLPLSHQKRSIILQGDNQLGTSPQGTNLVFQTQLMCQIRDAYRLDSTDSLLLETYFRTAYKTFIGNGETERIWLDTVPRLVFGNEFLLHGLLACTAQYMIHNGLSDCQKLTIRACSHQDRALPAFRSAIEHPTEGNCDAIMAFSFLLVVYTLTTELQKPNNSLLLVENGKQSQDDLIVPLWLHFLREGCCMLCDVWERIEMGPVGALAAMWDIEVDASSDLPYMNHFQSVVPDILPLSETDAVAYTNAALALSQSFAAIRHSSDITSWEIIGSWPMRVETEFMRMLYKRHPGALILLAYYCIILQRMEGSWYFQGRAAKEMTSILSILGTRWHTFIQEPISLVLGDQCISTEPLEISLPFA